MINPLSFACELIEAMPEQASLYLSNSDLLIPNRRWRSHIGETSRLRDLQDLPLNTDDLRERMLAIKAANGDSAIVVPLDAQSVRTLHVSKVPDHTDLYFLLIRDETELRRVDQMRKDFIANVSHELRTPLTAVRGYIETLMDPEFQTIERVREFLPVIFEHTERLHNLTLDLLSFSRLESPDTHIDLQPLVLREEIEDALEAVAPVARLKGLRIDTAFPEESLRVQANSEHLQRVLVNLLDNAVKYSGHGQTIRVWTEVRDCFVWTHVSDQGPGIPPEELQRVFERFYRTKGALTGRVRGSGLGLAISKHIVQQLGGEIGVYSAVGEGSDFYFSLSLVS
jgi:two-component system phosphate regulon sensor histidine kinase PhoR